VKLPTKSVIFGQVKNYLSKFCSLPKLFLPSTAMLVIERLRNLGSTPDAVARRKSLKKTPNAILGPSSLAVVLAQPDTRQQTGPFCVRVV